MSIGALLFGALLTAACSGVGLSNPDVDGGASVDLSSPPVDLPPPVDLSLPPPPPPDLTSHPAPPDLTALGPWGCLGNDVYPTPSQPQYKVMIVVSDYLSKALIAGATVRVCGLQDLTCAAPLFPPQTTDANGRAFVVAPSRPGGLAAYVEISATGYVETLAFPMTHDPDHAFGAGAPLDVPIFANSTLNLVYGILGIAPDPTRGSVAFTVDDCSYTQPAAGMSVAIGPADSGTHVSYVAGNFPSHSATQTDASGAGFITNSLTGIESVKVGNASVGTTSVDSFVVRPGALTAIDFLPNQ